MTVKPQTRRKCFKTYKGLFSIIYDNPIKMGKIFKQALHKKRHRNGQFSSVQSLSRVQLFATPWTADMPGRPVRHQLLESTQTHVHWISDAIQTSHLPSSPSLPALNLSLIRVFSNESALHMRWPKYWSFSCSISPSNEHPGLIFRMDWLDLLAVQGTLKRLLQHHSSKASILQHSAFFIVQLSHS